MGAFPDGNSALMLVCARLCHVAGIQWDNKKYMTMKHPETSFSHPLYNGSFLTLTADFLHKG